MCWPHDCCLLNPFLVSCYRHQNFAHDLILSLCSLFSSVIKSSAIHQRFVFCRAFWSQLPFFSQGRVSMKSYDLRINVMALCRKHSRKLFWFSVSIWGVLRDFFGGNPLFLLKLDWQLAWQCCLGYREKIILTIRIRTFHLFLLFFSFFSVSLVIVPPHTLFLHDNKTEKASRQFLLKSFSSLVHQLVHNRCTNPKEFANMQCIFPY